MASYSPFLKSALVRCRTVASWSRHSAHLNSILRTAANIVLVSASYWSSWAALNPSSSPTAFHLAPILSAIAEISSSCITLSVNQ